MSTPGYSGRNYDSHVDKIEQSTIHRMKETFWTTKQAVMKKMGKKEDKHVVASDHELDAKLEVFKSIQRSSIELLKIIEKYQERLCSLSQEENTMGRFLKQQQGHDKTRAGKMMAAVGKSQSFAAQQRLSLRVPLVRLYQEVETFRYRAVSDTLLTINRMEGARTEYRGALLWMKNVSEELDPDTYKQLEKFLKVQAQVKKSKAKFDKLKLDVMQKVDLLAASRCNMFSHVLANYQSTLLTFWEKTSRTMTAVAESFRGYQYYEFNMLKELDEPSKRLAEETSKAKENEDDEFDPEKLIALSDDENNENNFESTKESSNFLKTKPKGNGDSNISDDLDCLGLSDKDLKSDSQKGEMSLLQLSNLSKTKKMADSKKDSKDLLGDTFEPITDADTDDLSLLNEILNAPEENDFAHEWSDMFGSAPVPNQNQVPVSEPKSQSANFMPSNLLDMSSLMGREQMFQGASEMDGAMIDDLMSAVPGMGPPPMNQGLPTMPQAASNVQQQQQKKPASKKGQKQDMTAWFNLFADLDPLSNPDTVGKQNEDISGACM